MVDMSALSNLIPKSWIKSLLIAAVAAIAGWGSKAILSQVGSEYDLGYGAKLVITQSIADSGTNAVAIVAKKAVDLINKQ